MSNEKIEAQQKAIDKGLASGISDKSVEEVFAIARENAFKKFHENHAN
jgi:hypothetical protein